MVFSMFSDTPPKAEPNNRTRSVETERPAAQFIRLFRIFLLVVSGVFLLTAWFATRHYLALPAGYLPTAGVNPAPEPGNGIFDGIAEFVLLGLHAIPLALGGLSHLLLAPAQRRKGLNLAELALPAFSLAAAFVVLKMK